VTRAQLEKQKVYFDKYGIWLALVSWFPFVGYVFTIALGFYKTNPWLTALLFLVGRTLRFFVWNLLLGAY
jgi:membrane protein YqaA with SNARE-associated domain